MLSIRFNCTNCNTPLKADKDIGGMEEECPACKEMITVPRETQKLPLPASEQPPATEKAACAR